MQLTDAGMPELKEELRELSKDTVVLYLLFLRDAAGKRYHSGVEVLEELTSSCDLPFYTYKEMDMGHGALGGVVISPSLMARKAAQMAAEIIRGKSADDIPIVFKTAMKVD